MNGLVKELRAGRGLVSHTAELAAARRAHSPMIPTRWAVSVNSRA